MGVLVRIETKTLDVLEWGQEFSPEQQDYLESYIRSFEGKLENYLTYSSRGFGRIFIEFDFNPITRKFILKNCSNYEHLVRQALSYELSVYV